jgi:hypothetical protein
MTYKTNYEVSIIYAEKLNAIYLTNLRKRQSKILQSFSSTSSLIWKCLYGSEYWSLTKQQLQQIESS